ncbi:MAG: hypothetical protein LIV24_09545, partial [Eubacterium sp.]|nr:hypothetical protein [Eubacterium sp.]
MKKKNTFRKWMALFLSISMVAASGITSNVHLRAAEDTPVQETATENTDASASDQNTDTVTDVNQNDTTRTEEIGLDGTEQSTDNTDNASEQTVAEPD